MTRSFPGAQHPQKPAPAACGERGGPGAGAGQLKRRSSAGTRSSFLGTGSTRGSSWPVPASLSAARWLAACSGAVASEDAAGQLGAGAWAPRCPAEPSPHRGCLRPARLSGGTSGSVPGCCEFPEVSDIPEICGWRKKRGLQSPTRTVVTIRDLLLSESVTLGPRPLEISVMFKPSEGLHAPT